MLRRKQRCTVEDCTDFREGFGYCLKHYRRYKRHGSPTGGTMKRGNHGMIYTVEYGTWLRIKRRCDNKKQTCYKDYGGRGIKVCDRWLESFMNFYNDMGDRPSSLHSIDRIDNDGNYEPSNCRWATRKQQNNNKRTSRHKELSSI